MASFSMSIAHRDIIRRGNEVHSEKRLDGGTRKKVVVSNFVGL